MRHLKIWFCIIVIVLLTVCFLLMNKRDAYSFDEIINSESLTIHFMENYTDQISGLYNNWNVYNDIYVESYEDLVKVSDYIFHVKINSLSQIEDAIFTNATIINVLKDENALYEADDEITFLQMNKITYNEKQDSFTMQMYSPCMITKKGNEYIVFFNKIDQYKTVFRTSTICYSIVPVNTEINIIQYDENDYNQINKNQISILYSKYKNYDYVVSILNDNTWLKDNTLNSDEVEEELLTKAFEKEKKRLDVYIDIVHKLLENLDAETNIKITNY